MDAIKGKNIIITGGNFRNKGAQAMLLITYYRLKEMYPDINYYYSSDDTKPAKAVAGLTYLNKYILFNALRIKAGMGVNCFDLPEYLFRTYNIIKKKNSALLFKEKSYIDILDNTLFILDVSGFAISSKFMNRITWNLINLVENAHTCGIKVIIMPQSFGPFDYRCGRRKICEKLGVVLKYPEMIFARESEGFNLLKYEFKLDNLQLSTDLVLQSKNINWDNMRVHDANTFEIKDKSVAIIPNKKIMEKMSNSSDLFGIYAEIISGLLERGKEIYLVSHSSEDIILAKKIKNYFENDTRVHMIEYELNCYEFEDIVEKFEYIIASRYHSIVLAYRRCVPVIGIGWAVKYEELFDLLNQSEYIVKIVEIAKDKDSILRLINKMDESYEKEAITIKEALVTIQEKDCFKKVFDCINHTVLGL